MPHILLISVLVLCRLSVAHADDAKKNHAPAGVGKGAMTAACTAHQGACVDRAKSVAEALMKTNAETFKAGKSEINCIEKLSSKDTQVVQVVGVDAKGKYSTVGYQVSLSLPGCLVTKFELIGAQ